MRSRTSDDQEKAIFHSAHSIQNAAQREIYLQAACGNDHELRSCVDSLIAAAHAAGDFLESPPLDSEEVAPLRSFDESVGGSIGSYKLLEQIGEGGFGVVYMAEQREPIHRRLALKIIKVGMDTKQVVARFEAERKALALMDHPNIAKVIDAGATEAGRPFFVMELVRGEPITEFCDQLRLTTNERLKLFVEVCSAIQHAHQKGIIHRDIKPSNVLVTMYDDRPVPKVIDFGIAKATEQPLTNGTVFTRFRQFIGTPVYMSPEQAKLSGLDIDTRSDIYSLGVLLYELLSGIPPFDGQQLLAIGYDEVCRVIRDSVPPVPSSRVSTLGDQIATVAKNRGSDVYSLQSSLRGEVDWIVMKALEKDRSRRYDTASAMAADINRFLNQEPVLAGPPGATYRAKKFLQRNRIAVLASMAVVTSLVVGAVAATFGMLGAIESRNETEHAKSRLATEVATKAEALRESEQARRESERLTWRVRHMNYANQLQSAAATFEGGERVDLALDSSPLNKCDPALRGWEWHWLNEMTRGDVEQFGSRHIGGLIDRVAYTSDGATAVCSTRDGTIYVYDAHSQTLIGDPMVTWGSTFALSPDGKLIATLYERDGEHVGIAITVLEGQQVVATLPGHRKSQSEAFTSADPRHASAIKQMAISSMRFSPEGNWLAVGTNDGELSLWDVENKSLRNTVAAHDDVIMNIEFSPNGEQVATASPDAGCAVRLWNTKWLEPVRNFLHEGGVLGITFGRDGHTLVTGGLNGQVKCWGADKVESLVQLESWVYSVGFDRDGKRFFAADARGRIIERDVSAQQEVRRIDLDGWTFDMAINPSGEDVLLGHGSYLVRWNLNEVPNETSFETHAPITSLSINETENRLACAHSDDSITLWDLNTRRELARVRPHRRRTVFATVGFARTGDTLVSGGRDGQLLLLDHRSLRTIRKLHQGHESVTGYTISPDGQQVVFKGEGAQEAVVVRTDGNGRRALKFTDANGGDFHFDFSSDGKLLAACTSSEKDNGTAAVVWDLATGRIVKRLNHTESFGCCGIEFFDGNSAIILASSRATYLWNLESNELIAPFELSAGWRRSYGCYLLPDERRLLMPFWNGILVYDVSLQLPLCEVPFPNVVPQLALGRTRLIVGGRDKKIRIVPLTWPSQ